MTDTPAQTRRGAPGAAGAPPPTAKTAQATTAPAAPDPAALPDENAQLLTAERAGLRLAAACRTAALGGLALWGLGSSSNLQSSLWTAGLLGSFALLGLAHAAVIGTRFDRSWFKFAAVAFDYAALACVYAFVPVSLSGETGQILAFRAYSVIYMALPLALATLSLSPALVLWAGACATAAWWTAFVYVVSGMERTLSWADLPAGADRETYQAVYLDPDFIGRGSRVVETIILLSLAGILALAVGRARKVLRERARAEADRAFVARAFGEYVPAEAARQILGNRAALAPQMRRASVLSVDIAGFTALAEAMGPEAVIGCLNAFFADASEAVATAGGVIVDFSGDGFLAAFNAPIEVPDPEARALRAARAVLAMTQARDYAGHRLAIRAGIATGELAAGSVGGAGRRTYTIYGDVVNLAARLQELGKTAGRGLLTDAATAQAAGEGLTLLLPGQAIRGRAAPEDVFAPG